MDFFLIVVVILFVLAISDLSVGVSNDAVNFLNSALGSKAAPRNIIMIVASTGILLGTTFSSGLMEVARKGIFNPEQFIFPEIMFIFLSVMLTILILLDLYNTFGLPTSTTVSIVFALLGAAVAISAIKIFNTSENLADLVNYINMGKATAIIFGILLSVVIAFTCGSIIQFFVRLVFTFNITKSLKRYGAILSSISITLILYFILIKGAKGTSFLSAETIEWLIENTGLLLLINFFFLTIVLQLILFFTKINILKFVVLFGTFAIALSFAANDLVNFIGVPLAGLSAYNEASSVANPLLLKMDALREPVQTNTFLLLIAGGIMVVTLWFSQKAKSVTQTELNLGRQSEGFERFESSPLSRTLVRMYISLFELVQKITPKVIREFVRKRLDPSIIVPQQDNRNNAPSFDLLRATVNLTVASALISFATSLKLPLSTTYVTFMVAMGTSLSDKAWGRESAVYRVNGVITVIGGWFFTAFTAFTIAAIMAVIIYFGQLPAIIVLVIIAGYIIFKTTIFHKDIKKEEEEIEKKYSSDNKSDIEAVQTWLDDIQKFFNKISVIMENNLEGLANEDRVLLKQSRKGVKKLKKSLNLLIADLFSAVKLFKEDDLKEERRYGKIMASVQEIYSNVKMISQSSFDHIDNNHKKPTNSEIKELGNINKLLKQQINEVNNLFATKDFNNSTQFDNYVEDFQTLVKTFDANQINRLRGGDSGSRNTLFLLGILSEMDNISNHLNNLLNLIRKNYSRFEKRKVKEIGNK